MILKRISSFGDENWGTIGAPTSISTEHKSVCLGDIIAYKHHMSDNVCVGVVVFAQGKMTVMGSVGTDLRTLQNIRIIVPHNLLTQEILDHNHPNCFEIEEPKKMTLAEIEKELGYSVEIVEGE